MTCFTQIPRCACELWPYLAPFLFSDSFQNSMAQSFKVSRLFFFRHHSLVTVQVPFCPFLVLMPFLFPSYIHFPWCYRLLTPSCRALQYKWRWNDYSLSSSTPRSSLSSSFVQFLSVYVIPVRARRGSRISHIKVYFYSPIFELWTK